MANEAEVEKKITLGDKLSKMYDMGAGGIGLGMGLWGTGRSIRSAAKGGDWRDVLGAVSGGLGVLGGGIGIASKATNSKKAKGILGLVGSGAGVLGGGIGIAKASGDIHAILSGKPSAQLTEAEKKEKKAYQASSVVNGLLQAIKQAKGMKSEDEDGKKRNGLERTSSGLGMAGSLLGAVGSGLGFASNYTQNRNAKKWLGLIGGGIGIASGVVKMISSGLTGFNALKKMRAMKKDGAQNQASQDTADTGAQAPASENEEDALSQQQDSASQSEA